MNTQEARELGQRIATLIARDQIEPAYEALALVLAGRTGFALLRHIGGVVGAGAPPAGPGYARRVNSFLERIAAGKTMGGWVVMASALEQQFDSGLEGTLALTRRYVALADVWYGADIFGEGVLGRALVGSFQPTVDLLKPWREDGNAWVRRVVGVGVHYWAKRSAGRAELAGQAGELSALLEPMFGERVMDAAKGVGWGIKTLGRQYPTLVTDWLADRVVPGRQRHRAVMLRKALKYLSAEQRAQVTGRLSPKYTPRVPFRPSEDASPAVASPKDAPGVRSIPPAGAWAGDGAADPDTR